MTGRAIFVALMALLAVTVGCGGEDGSDDPQDEAARASVEEFLAAYRGGDGVAACRHLTAEAIRADVIFVSLAVKAREPAEPARSRREICEREVREQRKAQPDGLRRAIDTLRLGDIRLRGREGCVEVRNNRFGFPIVKRGERWQVNGLRPFVHFEPVSSQILPPNRNYTGR